MTDIRQSSLFADFMRDLGWKSEKIADFHIYLRKFPFAGYFAKIPRPNTKLTQKIITELKEKYKIFTLNIAPNLDINHPDYYSYKTDLLKTGFKINSFPFNPTTTILIDLTKSESFLFRNFSEAKRRAVRKAEKNGVTVKETDDFDLLINIRKKQYFPAGFLLTDEMNKLWKNFHPENASLLMAYSSPLTPIITSPFSAIAKNDYIKPLGGILLLFYDGIAYYWYASALKKGKKLFAPTLLVWEAIKMAKRKGCKILDFEGIYDGRFPKASKSWRGFTKFKEGFGGKKVVYMENFTLKRLPI